ncbi:MAG TPA: R3H domain-containing nucleic acid-binding protein [Erysipelothrix sp.]|nr:R3H domain-containing nucleic acid-binding protein [Erysipelothrix sp.]
MKVYTGKTLDDVLASIAQEKDVALEDITYYVKEEKAGFLGFGASVSVEAFTTKDVVEFVEDYLGNFFSALDMDVEIEVEQNKNSIDINLNASNNGILIGKNGQSLQGLNTLIRQVVNSTFKRRFFVFVDINNYKQNRYQKLRAMGRRVAKKVSRSKVDASLDPMPNDERRVIHQELSGMPNIRTKSEDSGRKRHLKIMYDPNKE